jgi:hypothetical protein
MSDIQQSDAPEQPGDALAPSEAEATPAGVPVPPELISRPFERWRALGFLRLLPVVPPTSDLPNAGKRPGVLNGDGGWHGRGVADFDNPSLDELRSWDAMGAGVGIRTGGEQAIIGLDVDTLNPEWATTIGNVAKQELPHTWMRIGQAPKFLLIFRAPPGVGYTCIHFDDGTEKGGLVELLAGDRKYFNWDTIHPGTGKPYVLTDGPYPGLPKLEDIPVLTEEHLKALFTELQRVLPTARGSSSSSSVDRASIDQEPLKGDLELVKSAVAALPNTRALFPTYNDMVRVGEAIHAATVDDPSLGEDLFHEWYGRWEGGDYDPDRADKFWRTFKAPHAIGAKWLYDKAWEHGGWTGWILRWFEPITDDAENGTCGLRIVIGRINSKTLPVRKWLVWPRLPIGNVVQCVGEPAVNKSTFALWNALIVATGDEKLLRGAGNVNPERLHRNGPVIVYNAEDPLDEMEKRLSAAQIQYGITEMKHPIILWSGVEDVALKIMRRDGGDRSPLKATTARLC